MTKILITGSSGFVGSNILRKCLVNNYEVHILLRSGSRNWRIKNLLTHTNLHVYDDDLSKLVRLKKTISNIRPDCILHLAAHGAYSFETDVGEILKTNVFGTWNLLQATKDIEYKLFVNTGSSSEYGCKSSPMNEFDIVAPNSYYAISKVTATHLSTYLAKSWHKPIVTARLFSVYGPYEDPNRLFPTMLSTLEHHLRMKCSSPAIARDYISVDDVVDFFLNFSELKNHPGKVFNVGTGIQTTLKQVVEIVEIVTKKKLHTEWGVYKAREWDTDKWSADMTFTYNALSWRPKHDFKSGIRQMYRWWQNEGRLLDAYCEEKSRKT